MPATSKAMFRYMKSCQHNPKHKGSCPSPDKIKEFTEGVEYKKLPSRAKRVG